MKKVATLLLITILQAQPNAIWIRTFGGINSDYGRSIQQVFNDGYILIGTTASFGDNNDAWLIKTDAQGNKEWDKTFGGSNDDFGSCIQQTIGGGYIITGWTKSFGNGNNDAWLIKIENPLAEIDDSFIPNIFVFHQNYPNPFNPITLLEFDLPKDELVNITIYDMKVRMIKTITNGLKTAGYKSVQWNATNDRNETVSAGVYLYSIQAGEFSQTKKMVLLK